MAGYFVMIWMYLRHKMYIMCRIIPLLRAFCLSFFFFLFFPFASSFVFRGLGLSFGHSTRLDTIHLLAEPA